MGDIAFTQERLKDVGKWVGEQKVLIVGNHCHSTDTELLTSDGWVNVEKITTDTEVATVCLSTNKLEYDRPKRVVVNEDSVMYGVKGVWIDEVVSSGHNLVIDNKLIPVSESVGEHDNRKFTLSAISGKDSCVNLTDDWIRLLTWVIMDGTMLRTSERKTRVQFKLSKERKIEALESLLKSLEIPYTKKECKKYGINKLQPFYIRIYGQASRDIHTFLNDSKQIPKDWSKLSRKQLEVFLQVLKITDGHTEVNKIHWTTINKNNVDIIQEACVKNGYAMCFKEKINMSGFSNGKLQYLCYICQGSSISSKSKVVVSELASRGKTIGVTVKHGTVISRRCGKVSVTGNCTDNIPMSEIVKHFDSVYSLKKYREFWLSHCPIHPAELRGKMNIHGHVHYATLDDKRYFNTSLENIDYKPINIEEIRKRIYEENKQ